MQATSRFHHVDLALSEYYEAVGHKYGAQLGIKYVLAEILPAYPIPGLWQWYQFITQGPPSESNKHPVYHALTRLVGWRHTSLLIVQLNINEKGQKDFDGIRWDLNGTANISRIERNIWIWQASSRLLPLGTTTMSEEEIEAAARAHLETYPTYHLVFWNCAFFALMVFGAINSDNLGDNRRRLTQAWTGWLDMSKLTLMLILTLVVIWNEPCYAVIAAVSALMIP